MRPLFLYTSCWSKFPMRRLRKTVVILLVWATAASTLLAGLPHLECGCPAARGNPNKSGTSAAGKTCCCGGSCFSASESNKSGTSGHRPNKRHSCCGGGAQEQGQAGSEGRSTPDKDKVRNHEHRKSGRQDRGNSNGCPKRLVTPQQQAWATVETKGQQNLTVNLFVVALSPLAFSAPDIVPFPHVWEVSRQPPPTDLVTLLQRLTI
jgi:hypothetical protein